MQKCFCQFATIVGLLAPLSGFAQNARLLTTITNPSPDAVEYFGMSVATMGSDRLLIGAPGDYGNLGIGGVAYLFSANGTPLTTFASPASETGDEFGRPMVALGGDRVLIGAPNDSAGAPYSGVAYLFSTNGALLTTFTNPAPSSDDNFGIAIAAVGTDRVLIGAPYDYDAPTLSIAGAAYLFSTNGTLLHTFTNPVSPAGDVSLGLSVAAVGNDRLLIGKYGAAYLFSVDGTLLATFSKPGPPGWFGPVVAAMNDRVIIGAPDDNTSAYLFSTNGTLLTIFTNPAPASFSGFGNSVAALGNDRVLIRTVVGLTYVFSTSGTLLSTLANPNSGQGYWWGNSVVAVGSDRILVGGYRDNTGPTNAGAAYLFSLEPPGLSVMSSGGSVIVSWPKWAVGFVLEQTVALPPLPPGASGWLQVPIATYQTNATSIFITLSDPIRYRFYRLRQP